MNKNELLRMRDGHVQHHLRVTKLDEDQYEASTTDRLVVGTGMDEISAIRDAKKKIEEFYLDASKGFIN